jgi:hypothetical protein
MKKLLLVAGLFLTIFGPALGLSLPWAGAARGQDNYPGPKQDMKNAGKSAGRAAKKSAHKVKRQTKKGVHSSARTVRKGAGKVERKTEPQ